MILVAVVVKLLTVKTCQKLRHKFQSSKMTMVASFKHP